MNHSKKVDICLANELEIRFDTRFLMIDNVLKKWAELHAQDDETISGLLDKSSLRASDADLLLVISILVWPLTDF